MSTATRLSKKQLDKMHRDAFNYLDDHYAYFVSNIVRLGNPRWTNGIPTAAVAISGKKGKLPDVAGGEQAFEYLFNPDFASTLDVQKMAFIEAHEAMHILLNHLKLVNNYLDKDRYNEIRAKIESGQKLTRQDTVDSLKMQQVAMKFNIAADCVINDYLAQAGLAVGDEYCTGEKYIGESAAFMTVNDVYERLPNQSSQNGQDGDEESQAYKLGQSDGRGQGGVDSHDWMFDPDFAEKVADMIDEMNKEIEKGNGLPADLQDKRDEEAGQETQDQKNLRQSMRAGSEEGNIRQFQEQIGVELAWVKLMKEVDPMIFKEPGREPPPRPAWHKRPRKLGAAQFRDVTLPVYQDDVRREKRSNEKPAIVMALDHSGSIGPNDADRFTTLALSIPRDRIKLFCCTFTTSYRVFDPDNPDGGGYGGTDFDAITAFINNEVLPELNGKYPKAVIVITDGEAQMSRYPSPEEQKGWLWLISPYDRSGGYYPASNDIGRKQMLTEYIV